MKNPERNNFRKCQFGRWKLVKTSWVASKMAAELSFQVITVHWCHYLAREQAYSGNKIVLPRGTWLHGIVGHAVLPLSRYDFQRNIFWRNLRTSVARTGTGFPLFPLFCGAWNADYRFAVDLQYYEIKTLLHQLNSSKSATFSHVSNAYSIIKLFYFIWKKTYFSSQFKSKLRLHHMIDSCFRKIVTACSIF
jgi:hypothetical protein